MSNNSESGRSPTFPPAPPAKGRPAPPAKGRPAPPNNIPPKPPNEKIDHSEENDNTQKLYQRAMNFEEEENYAEAAVLYRELGMRDNENRCLNLALAQAKTAGTTNIHYGDKIVNDSVIMKED